MKPSRCLCVCQSNDEVVRDKQDKEWREKKREKVERQLMCNREGAAEGWSEAERSVCRPVCHCCWGRRKRREKEREERTHSYAYTSGCCHLLSLHWSTSEKPHLHKHKPPKPLHLRKNVCHNISYWIHLQCQWLWFFLTEWNYLN